jgi:chaperonin GroES
MTKDAKKTKSTEIMPLGERVLIKEENNKESKTAAGIIIPITVSDDKVNKSGVVVAVGSGIYQDGKLIPLSVKKGDTVLFQWADKIKVEDKEYFIVKESEILAIIN